MSENTVKLVNIINELQKKKKGRYMDNVIQLCSRDYNWSSHELDEYIRTAIAEGNITEIMFEGKSSLRVIESDNDIVISDPVHHISTQTENSIHHISTQTENSNYISNLSNANSNINYGQELFIQSLYDRIAFLEKSLSTTLENQQHLFAQLLNQNQQLFDKISSQNTTQNITPNIPTQIIPVPNNSPQIATQISNAQPLSLPSQSQPSTAKSTSSTINTPAHAPAPTPASVTLNIDKITAPAPSQVRSTVNLEQQGPSNTQQRQNKSKARPTTSTMKNVTIIGDSMLGGIDEYGIRAKVDENTSVKVRSHPGATSSQMIHHVTAQLMDKPDLLIVHCATNDLTKKDLDETGNKTVAIKTIDNMKTIFELVREKSPSTEIAWSEVTNRYDAPTKEKAEVL